MKARDRDGEEDNLHQFNSDSDIRMDENKVTHWITELGGGGGYDPFHPVPKDMQIRYKLQV